MGKNFKFSRQNEYIKNTYDLNLLTEKGIYPYDYMDNWDKFDEKELPPHECFYSELAGGNISDKDYREAGIVCVDL